MCEESSHMCEACSHFPLSFMPCMLFHVCPLHMRVKLTHTCVRSHASHTSSTSWSCHHQRLLTHVWAYCPLWLVINPNPCGAYLASTSLILRDPSPPSFIRSQPSVASLISYKRRAPLLIFISLSSLLLCCWFCEQPHPMEWWNHQSFDGFMRFAFVFWFHLCTYVIFMLSHLSYFEVCIIM